MPSHTTRYSDARPGFRRSAAGIAVALHVALIVLAVLVRADRSYEQPATIATFDVIAPGPPSPDPPQPETTKEVPPQPPEPVIVPPVDIVLPTDNTMQVAMIEQDAMTASGGGCDLTDPVQAALRADPQIAELMPTVERDRRSVANALAVWNQVWIEPDRRFPEPALAAIRDTVRRTVEASSDTCRFQKQGGPRLIYLPIGASTTVLALGSGKWTWQEVADSAAPEALLERAAQTGANGPRQAAPAQVTERKTLFERIFGQ